MTEVPRPRLVGWAILVTGLAALSYAAHFAGGEPADDVLYEWATAAAALVQYGIILAIVLALARGIAPRIQIAASEARIHPAARPHDCGRRSPNVAGAMPRASASTIARMIPYCTSAAAAVAHS